MPNIEEFLTYHKFNDEYLAADFAKTLTENKIESYLVNNSTQFDPSFANNEILKEYLVKIPANEFRKAEVILKDFYGKLIEEVPEDYYIFFYSDEELLEIIHNDYEWNEYDVALADKILKQRNVPINYDNIEKEKLKKFKQEIQQKKIKSWKIILGYFGAFLGGFPGIIYGYYLKNDRKTISNGERMYANQFRDRKHGTNIMWLGILFFSLWLFLSLFKRRYL